MRDALTGGEDWDLLIDDIEQNARIIKQNGYRADGIVKGMMAHARSGSGHREVVALNALVAEHVDLAYHGQRAHLGGFHIEVACDLSEEVGTVEAVPQDLGRVVLNLVTNAFDAVQEEAAAARAEPYTPTVQVATRRVGNHVEVRVRDNGPGIPADLREKIFEPFFTTKPAGTGTGLGLSLSYDIITQGHGGTLAVECPPGRGTTFVVTLPADP